MRIVIDTRGENFQLPGGHYRLRQLFFQWALQHPEDEFCWLQAPVAESVDLPNVQVVAVPELPRHWGRLTRWYLQELPKIWGSASPDWLIPVPGFAAIGLDCRQALLWLHQPRYHFLEGRLFSRLAYRRALPKMLQTASAGWLNADGWASLAAHADQLDLSCWKALPPVAAPAGSSPVNEASLYEMDYHTGGRPFFASFITSDATEPVMNLMRAFSLFKKRQQTDWKLVIAGDKGGDHRELKRALAAYKYRDDTVLLEATTAEKHMLLRLAYALVQGPDQVLSDAQLLLALEHSCPLLLGHSVASQSWLGSTPFFASSEELNATAESMMRVYKDEEFRRQLCHASGAKFRSLTLEEAGRSFLPRDASIR